MDIGPKVPAARDSATSQPLLSKRSYVKPMSRIPEAKRDATAVSRRTHVAPRRDIEDLTGMRVTREGGKPSYRGSSDLGLIQTSEGYDRGEYNPPSGTYRRTATSEKFGERFSRDEDLPEKEQLVGPSARTPIAEKVPVKAKGPLLRGPRATSAGASSHPLADILRKKGL